MTGAPETKRIRVHITGRVQGVCFRAETRNQALKLGLGGWVRNLRDGRVEALFDGPADRVREMLRWCKKGPPLASVSFVEVLEEQPGDPLTGFDIRYGL